MKRKNATRNALFTSILSLLLCVSMLVGTTFAWFTDEVVSGLNTIQAGNLDVELYAGNTQVKEDTQLFVAELWEPGMVVYENLQVRNVGTLALKYQMTLTVAGENNLNGHKLSEVVKIAVVDEIAPGATRQEVLAAAKASDNIGTIGNFFATGELKAGENSDVEALVVFWEPNANEIDNLYNANNGQKTSDGQPLYIEFGVNLQATQLMHEYDSFGNDYDKFATILPKAKVLDLGAKTVNATTNEWGNGKTATAYELPFVLQFQPNESLDEANLSAYKYWHADYVVKADRDVPANSIALLGYYQAFCDDYNGGNWVALSADDTITAGTEIRLVDVMGGGDNDGTGSIKVTYKDICQWGNDGVGFLCSAADLTGVNAGTTLTVELRMFANESDPSDSSYNGGTETGESYLIGTYTYTFPAAKVATQAELNDALSKGVKDIELADGTYSLPSLAGKDGVTITGGKDTVIGGEGVSNGFGGNFGKNTTIKNVTFYGDSTGVRWSYANGGTTVFENCSFLGNGRGGFHIDEAYEPTTFIFNNCTLSGFNAFGGTMEKVVLNGCTLTNNGKYNGLNMYCDLELNNCKFEFTGVGSEFVDFEAAGQTLTITNCTATKNGVAIDLADMIGGSKISQTTITIDGVSVVK